MVLLFSEPTQVLEYLRILNGAKFRWTMGEGREGQLAGEEKECLAKNGLDMAQHWGS